MIADTVVRAAALLVLVGFAGLMLEAAWDTVRDAHKRGLERVRRDADPLRAYHEHVAYLEAQRTHPFHDGSEQARNDALRGKR